MKELKKQYKSILLITFFVLGVVTFSSALVISGMQNYWTQTCNIYPDSGFFCANNSAITDQVLGALLVFGLGTLLLVKWLKLLSVKRLLLVAITNAVLSLLLIVFWHRHFLALENSSGDFFNSWYVFHLNWSGPILAALVSSLWVLPPVRKTSQKRAKKLKH